MTDEEIAELAKDPEKLAQFRKWLKAQAAEKELRALRLAIMERRKQKRALLREGATPARELTVDALIAKLDGFIGVGPAGREREYFEHFVQPYCECAPGEGWELCDHALDLGFWC